MNKENNTTCPSCDGEGNKEVNILVGEEGMKVEADVMVDCPECDGTGKVYYSCCGDDVKGTQHEDYGICPTCKENLSGEHEDCETCGGTGEVKNN